MEITQVPIVDFYKYCIDSANERGYVFVLCLLARTADSENAYQQIKKYWNSLNDLTGDQILFVFAGMSREYNNVDSVLFHENESYRGLYNTSLSIVNNHPPKVRWYRYPTFNYSTDFDEMAIKHTNSISALRDYLGLSEKDVPSLVFTTTWPYAQNKNVIIKLNNDNLYRKVKLVIETLYEPLMNYKKNREIIQSIDRESKQLKYAIIETEQGLKEQNRFTKAKSHLNEIINDTNDIELRNRLQVAMQKKDIKICHEFNQPIRAFLNQYIDLYKNNPALEQINEQNILKRTTILNKQKELDSYKEKMYAMVTQSYNELVDTIMDLNEKKRDKVITEKVHKNPEQYDYDVALSFAGEDREYVENVADILKKKSVRVFYDMYERINLWGKDLFVHLDNIYQHEARYCIMFISKYYKLKLWTNHEMRSAFARAYQLNNEYILPVRFDDTEIPGIRSTTGYIDLREVQPYELASLIMDKLGN